ncbi:MAG: GAF domain-containing sensor histidine kinase [Athalassotoga sp.]
MPILFYVNLVSFIASIIMMFISIRYYFSKESFKNPYLFFMISTSFFWNLDIFFEIFNVPSDQYLLPVFFILFQTIPALMISYGLKFRYLYIAESALFAIGMATSVLLIFSPDLSLAIGILSTFNVIFSITFMRKKYSTLISFTKRSRILSYMVFYGLFSVLEAIIAWLWIYKNSMWPYIAIMNSILIPVYLYTVINLVYEKQLIRISTIFLKNVLYGAIISTLISSILMISYYTNFYFSKNSGIIQFFSMTFVVIFISFLVFGDYLQKIDTFFERLLRTGRGYKREKTIDFVKKSLEIDSLEELNSLVLGYCKSVLNVEDVELFFKEDDGNYTSIKRHLTKNDVPFNDVEKIVDLYNVTFSGIFFEKELFVWMKNAGKVEGFMVLGHKRSGRYSPEDLEWIETLSNHLTFFLSRYRSVQRVLKVEKTMIFQERMAAIGKLSSGVTHEIRNPLNIISTSLQMLKNSSDPKENEKLWKYIEEELSRINSILENFLYFARQKPPVIEDGDPSEIVKKISLLLGESASKKNIEIKTYLPDAPFTSKFDKTMLMEILLNIGTNALDAVEFGGWITFKLENLGNFFRISVSNNGKPIPSSEIQHIFEPFYTTKEKGTGLGLSIVYNYINAMKGHVEVKSDEKETTFSVTIPTEVKI